LVKLRKVWKWASTPRKATKLDVVVVSVALATAYYFAWRACAPADEVAQHTTAVEKLKTETVDAAGGSGQVPDRRATRSRPQWNAACKADGQGRKCSLSRRQHRRTRQQAGRVRNACLLKHTLTN
jgi:hypothetical protein